MAADIYKKFGRHLAPLLYNFAANIYQLHIFNQVVALYFFGRDISNAISSIGVYQHILFLWFLANGMYPCYMRCHVINYPALILACNRISF